MQPLNIRNQRPVTLRRRRRIPGTRAHQACLNCKDKKLKCDDQNPACGNCTRLGITCLVQDPQTKKHRPRNYLEMLEGRVARLEGQDHSATPQSAFSPLRGAGSNDTASVPSNPYTPETMERTSDLSSRVGMLDFQTTNMEPQYLGSSSAFAFSRIINFSLSRDLPTQPSLATLNDRRNSPTPCLLPEYDVAVRLSNAYFKYIHPQYPFLHEPTFRSWETMLYESAQDFNDISLSSMPLFFLNMVYAVAALLLPNTGSLSEQLYTSAQLYADVLSHDNIESIQALLCYAMYSLRAKSGPSLWKISGLALRQCIELGYHRGIKRLAPAASLFQREMRKRVFWVAHGIDCMVALRLGRPLGISTQDIDAELPLNLDDIAISDLGTSINPEDLQEQTPTTVSTAIHVFKLRLIWARIHTSLFSDTSSFSINDDAYQRRIEQLRTDLDNWLATAPCPRSEASDDLSMFARRSWYELNYSYTILLLYRSQLAEYKESSSRIFDECIEASRNVCQGYRRLYIGTSIKYTWGTLHCLFMAGLTYLHCLWTSPTAWELIRPVDVSKTCTDCTMVLVAIAEGWQSAAPYRDIFEALANRTVDMVISKSRTVTIPVLQQGSSEFEGQDGWSHWITDMAEAGVLDGVDGLLTGFIGDFISHVDC